MRVSGLFSIMNDVLVGLRAKQWTWRISRTDALSPATISSRSIHLFISGKKTNPAYSLGERMDIFSHARSILILTNLPRQRTDAPLNNGCCIHCKKARTATRSCRTRKRAVHVYSPGVAAERNLRASIIVARCCCCSWYCCCKAIYWLIINYY